MRRGLEAAHEEVAWRRCLEYGEVPRDGGRERGRRAGADVQHGGLCQAAESLVSRLHGDVRAGMYGAGGERRVQPEVRAMCLIHQQHRAARMALLQKLARLTQAGSAASNGPRMCG